MKYSNISNEITVKLNERKNNIVVKQKTRIEYDFVSVPSIDDYYETYRVKSIQKLTKYKVHDNSLDVYCVSFSQKTKEDILGGGAWVIVDIDNFAQFLDNDYMDWVPNIGNFELKKDSYAVPEGYKITDGLNDVKKIVSNKVISKKERVI